MKLKPPLMRYAKFCAVLIAVSGVWVVEVRAQQGLTADQLHGCWRHESLQTIGRSNRRAFVDFCFRTDGTVYQWYIEPAGEAGEDSFRWALLNDHDLVINRQTCGA